MAAKKLSPKKPSPLAQQRRTNSILGKDLVKAARSVRRAAARKAAAGSGKGGGG